MLIAFPVLPLLASTMVSPGGSSPSRSARSIMYLAMRALIDPEGLRYSSLTQIPSTMISGVLPIASRIVPPPGRTSPAAGSRAPCATAAGSRASRAAEPAPIVASMPAAYVCAAGPNRLPAGPESGSLVPQLHELTCGRQVGRGPQQRSPADSPTCGHTERCLPGHEATPNPPCPANAAPGQARPPLEVIARLSSGRAAELDRRAAGSDIDLGPVAGLHDPGAVEVSPGSTMSRPRPRSMAPSQLARTGARLRSRGNPPVGSLCRPSPEQVVGPVGVVDEFPARPWVPMTSSRAGGSACTGSPGTSRMRAARTPLPASLGGWSGQEAE